MKKENDELSNLFRSRLENAEISVRDNFWELLENDIPVVLNKRRKLMIRRFSAAASVMLILGGASAAFWYYSPKDEIADAFQQVAITTGTKGSIINDGIIEEFPPVPINNVATNQRPVRFSSGVQETENIEEDTFSFSFSVSFSVTEQEESNENSSNRVAGGIDNSYSYQQEQQTKSQFSYKPVKVYKKRTWSVGVFGSTHPASARQNSNALQMLTKADNALNIMNAPGTVSAIDFLSQTDYESYMRIYDELNEADRQSRVHHKMPISVGLSVKKDLTRRFALETGLVYTQLNSELTGGKDTHYHQEQKLHYIGIPLKAGYTLYDTNHLGFYAAAGGMVEKCIDGNVKTNYYTDGQKFHSGSQSMTVDPLQFSLMAAIGVEYKFCDRLSVYAEPGISYYFDEGSSVNTIRKERPLNINLLCGVRMTY